jgi:hypothetical protein
MALPRSRADPPERTSKGVVIPTIYGFTRNCPRGPARAHSRVAELEPLLAVYNRRAGDHRVARAVLDAGEDLGGARGHRAQAEAAGLHAGDDGVTHADRGARAG